MPPEAHSSHFAPITRRHLVITAAGVLAALSLPQASRASVISVPSFNQKAAPWNTDHINGTTSTIDRYGCFITCLADIHKLYGVATDPGEMNNWLATNGGYQADLVVPPNSAGRGVTYNGKVSNPSLAAINAELDAGWPVILETIYPNVGTHFVVLTGHSGSTYYMCDPVGGTSGTSPAFNDKYTVYANMHKYRGSRQTRRLAVPGDYDRDWKSDVALFRPSEGRWYINQSGSLTGNSVGFGQPGDIPTPGDYDGDGQTDIALFRPSEGKWYVIPSNNTGGYCVGFGQPGDIPVPSDYDGDGKTDIALFRPSEGKVYIINSHDHSGTAAGIGQPGDIPMPGDYDGDGRTDLVVFRPSEGRWYINYSNGRASAVSFGNSSSIPVVGDFDGDGKADIAVFNPGESKWYITNSSNGFCRIVSFGQPGDIPVSGDFDGDGKTDIAVFRPSEGKWYVNYSSGGCFAMGFGQSGDIPVIGYLSR